MQTSGVAGRVPCLRFHLAMCRLTLDFYTLRIRRVNRPTPIVPWRHTNTVDFPLTIVVDDDVVVVVFSLYLSAVYQHDQNVYVAEARRWYIPSFVAIVFPPAAKMLITLMTWWWKTFDWCGCKNFMLSLGISKPNKAGAEATQRRKKSEKEQEGKGFLLAHVVLLFTCVKMTQIVVAVASVINESQKNYLCHSRATESFVY